MIFLFSKKICKLSFLIKALFIVLMVSSCAPMIDNRGNFPEEKKLAEVTPGKTTAYEVQGLFGSPSSRSVFGNEIWYYVSSQQQRFAFYKPKELERKILAITFDENSVVSDMKFYDGDDAVNVNIAGKETPTYGHSMGFLEQLLGNLGRFEK